MRLKYEWVEATERDIEKRLQMEGTRIEDPTSLVDVLEQPRLELVGPSRDLHSFAYADLLLYNNPAHDPVCTSLALRPHRQSLTRHHNGASDTRNE